MADLYHLGDGYTVQIKLSRVSPSLSLISPPPAFFLYQPLGQNTISSSKICSHAPKKCSPDEAAHSEGALESQ